VDRNYLQNTIQKLLDEKSVHDQKFAGQAVHAGCLPRFDEAVRRLQMELDKLDKPVENSVS